MVSRIPPYKECLKKLREIRRLKLKCHHNAEELKKLQKEEYYRNIIKRIYWKALHVLPDDVQRYIWSFVDINTRLNFLKTIYTPDFVGNKLSTLEINTQTVKKLFSCLKYVRRIYTHYLNKQSSIYIICHNFFCLYYPTNVECCMKIIIDIDKYKYKEAYFFNTIIWIIILLIKKYTKMYAITTNINELRENEKNMIKLFARIKIICS